MSKNSRKTKFGILVLHNLEILLCVNNLEFFYDDQINSQRTDVYKRIQ